MLTSRQLEALFVELTPRSKADLDLRGRALRGSSMIPHGPRGTHAPSLSAADAARLAIALGATRVASNAARATAEFLDLAPVGGREQSFAGATTFLAALQAALASYEKAAEIERVMLWHAPDERDEGCLIDVSPQALLAWSGTSGRRTCMYARPGVEASENRSGDVTVLSGTLLSEIAARLEGSIPEEVEGGWGERATEDA